MFEYAEDYTDISEGWTELLNKHADDGWRFVQAVADPELEDAAGQPIENGYRLIFERQRQE